jgi:hypothetical protein
MGGIQQLGKPFAVLGSEVIDWKPKPMLYNRQDLLNHYFWFVKLLKGVA